MMNRPFVVIPPPYGDTYPSPPIHVTPSDWESFFLLHPDPAIILNQDDLLLKTNQAFELIFGWSEDELVGIHAYDMPNIPEDKKFEVLRNKETTDLGETIKGYESVRVTNHGKLLHVWLSCFPLRNEDNTLYGRAVTLRIIKEKHSHDQHALLPQHIFFNDEFAAGIAHEIRNPLTTLKGFLQMMQANSISAHRAPYYYEIMTSEIERIELVLHKLLMLAKPKKEQYKPVLISTLIQEAIACSEEAANQHRVWITSEIQCCESAIMCDAPQIRQMFLSLIENAIESMPDGGTLTIRSRCSHQEVLICFHDEGLGIPSHILSRLGQPFYTTQTKGIGLGFMISQKIIETHMGAIRVLSEENKGTTIEVRLPLYHN